MLQKRVTSDGAVLDVPVPLEGIDAVVNRIVGRLRKLVNFSHRSTSIPKAELEEILRKAVLEAFSSADIHRVWIAEIDRLAVNSTSLEALQVGIAGYLRQAGIERVASLEDSARFRIVGGEGDSLEMLNPAYVDSITGKTMITGRVRRVG